jgi:hypothetical protein
MARILSENPNRALRQVIHFVGVRRFGETHHAAHRDKTRKDKMSTRNPDSKFEPDENDLVSIDPHAYAAVRAAHLTERYGSPSQAWDINFGGLDTGAAQARKASQELKNIIAANIPDPERPLRFSVTVANRQIALEVRPPQDPSGKWTCQMPCAIEGGWEWRTLQASGYDDLVGLINKQLAAAPLVRDLTAEESLELARMCTQKKNLAEVLSRYVMLRTGKPLDESVLHDPRLLHVLDAACLFIFFNSEPTSVDTPEFRAFLKTYQGTRPLNLPIVKSAYEEL